VAGWVEAADVVRRQPGTALGRAGWVGTVLGRAGRVHINLEDYQVSVGGDTHTIVGGTVVL
jgi:hypothetical protein